MGFFSSLLGGLGKMIPVPYLDKMGESLGNAVGGLIDGEMGSKQGSRPVQQVQEQRPDFSLPPVQPPPAVGSPGIPIEFKSPALEMLARRKAMRGAR